MLLLISASSLQALFLAGFVFSNMFLHLALSSLDCNTTLPPRSVCMQCLKYVGYFFFHISKITGLPFFSHL